MIGGHIPIKVPGDAIRRFIGWMTFPFCEDVFYDRTLVHSILLIITKSNAFRKSKIKPEVLAFTKGSLPNNVNFQSFPNQN